MCLFNFIQENNGVRLVAHLLRQLPTLFVTDITRGSSDQTARAKLLHVLRHVDPNHRVIATKHCVSQSLCQFRFPDTGWSQEEETPNRPVRRFQTTACTADGPGNGRRCFVLTNNPLVEFFFKIEQALAFLFSHLLHRHTGPLCNHFSDVFITHDDVPPNFAIVIRALCLNLGTQFLFMFANACGLFKILRRNCGVLSCGYVMQLLFKLLQSRRAVRTV